MNKGEFIAYLKEPASITPEVAPQLKELLKAYPAFQTGHVLLLKSLYETKDVLYEKYLTKIAAYAGNRELLYDYILGTPDIKSVEPGLKPVEISKEERNQQQETPEQEFEQQQEVFQEPKAAKENTYFDSVTISNDYFNISKITREGTSGDKFDGVHSFAQWLDIMSHRPNEADVDEEKPVQPNKKWELIDNFIKETPAFTASREKPVDKDGVVQDLSAKSVSDSDEFMTETLARIYIKQRNFEKALQIFKKLSLKYPEKSIYFAGQIKIVEQLKNNEK
ncbi:hypothetical protein ACE01N_01320 [Saccharicrinis sp. FJH2]|uniref:hypothetical protein n=1 Tax=Saccharicrinis sp. FJH65 TaxID=3344659 RepID=UPI0035F32470